jgi:hypothetical protein
VTKRAFSAAHKVRARTSATGVMPAHFRTRLARAGAAVHEQDARPSNTVVVPGYGLGPLTASSVTQSEPARSGRPLGQEVVPHSVFPLSSKLLGQMRGQVGHATGARSGAPSTRFLLVEGLSSGAPGRIRTGAPGSGGRCSIP